MKSPFIVGDVWEAESDEDTVKGMYWHWEIIATRGDKAIAAKHCSIQTFDSTQLAVVAPDGEFMYYGGLDMYLTVKTKRKARWNV